MARAVYSSQFILYTDATPNTQFIVPEGFTAVVRQYTLFTYIGAAVSQLEFQNSDEVPATTVAALSVEGAGVYVEGQGRFVLPGGGTMTIINTVEGTGAHIYVGGYLLRDD